MVAEDLRFSGLCITNLAQAVSDILVTGDDCLLESCAIFSLSSTVMILSSNSVLFSSFSEKKEI